MHNSCSPSAIYTHLISILFQRNLYLVRTPIIQRHICLNICGLWSIGNISFFHEVSPGRTNIFHWHARVLVRGQWYIFFYEICLNLRDLSWRLPDGGLSRFVEFLRPSFAIHRPFPKMIKLFTGVLLPLVFSACVIAGGNVSAFWRKRRYL